MNKKMTKEDLYKANLQYILYRKVDKEYDDFLKEIKAGTMENAIDKAGEIVVKSNITAFFEQNFKTTIEQSMVLLSLDNTLEFLFDAWERAEIPCPLKITEVINGVANYLIENGIADEDYE